jgi:hypothetical protein
MKIFILIPICPAAEQFRKSRALRGPGLRLYFGQIGHIAAPFIYE